MRKRIDTLLESVDSPQALREDLLRDCVRACPDFLCSDTTHRIMIVERCHSLADRIALVVECLGHEVRIACDGQAALVVAGNFRPEVILLDPTCLI